MEKSKVTKYHPPIDLEELQAIMKQDPRDYQKGGFQGFMCEVRYRVTCVDDIFYLRLDDELLAKAREYRDGNGGWQGRINIALGRFL